MARAFSISDSILSFDLKVRRLILRVYNLLTPLVSRTRIQKLRINGKTLGSRIHSGFLKILHSRIPEPIQMHGMKMYHKPQDETAWLGWCYAFDYEPETRAAFTQIVKPGMTVVDVGANIGYFTLLAAKLIRGSGRVFSFEPDPRYFQLVKKNIESNNLSASVEACRMAVADSERQSDFYLGRCTGSSFFKIPDSTSRVQKVQVTSLDNFFSRKGWPPVHLVKVDTEGADRLVLEGMHELVRRNSGLIIIVEFCPAYLEAAGSNAQELLYTLVDLGVKNVKPLSRGVGIYKIPEDIQFLIEFSKGVSYVNLLCEK